MKNKILITVYAISIDEYYDVFIPINDLMGEVVNLICKTIKGMTDSTFEEKIGLALLDANEGKFYDFSVPVSDTNLKNGKKVILFNY